MANEVVPDREQGRAREREHETDPVEVLRPVALPRELGVTLALLLGAIYPVAARATRPWYARRKVNDTGAGPLSASE